MKSRSGSRRRATPGEADAAQVVKPLQMADLPTVQLGLPGLERILEFVSTATKPPAGAAEAPGLPDGEAELGALRALAEYLIDVLMAKARSGDADAAEMATRLVERAVRILRQLAFDRPEILKPVARQMSAWPVLQSDLPDEIRANSGLLRSLEVGHDCPLNTMRLPPLSRSPRHSQESPYNAAVYQLSGFVIALAAIGEAMKRAGGYRRLRDVVRETHGQGASLLSEELLRLLPELEGLVEVRKDNLRAFLEGIWCFLKAETGGRPERILELRKPAVHRAKRAREAFMNLKDSLSDSPRAGRAKDQSEGKDSAAFDFLRGNLGDESMEFEIRYWIKDRLRRSLETIVVR